MAACNSDAIVVFKTPFRGQHVLTLIGAEQTTSLLVVMIMHPTGVNGRLSYKDHRTLPLHL